MGEQGEGHMMKSGGGGTYDDRGHAAARVRYQEWASYICDRFISYL